LKVENFDVVQSVVGGCYRM